MKNNRTTTIFLILILFAGLFLLLYPSFSDWWNSMHQSRAIADYSDQVAQLDDNQYETIWAEACAYNQSLTERDNFYSLTPELEEQYENLLNLSGTGIMGYVEVPAIGVSYPIYHGTDESVLQIAIGHIKWTSLPTGGESTHCVISGHTGLPSAKLFTNLNRLVEGDTFMLRTLDETLTYEVDQILIVLPHETSALQIEEGKDYCTLVTCTPYGVNSHRILVRGHRIENVKESKVIRVTSNAIMIEPLLVAPVVAAPMLLVALIVVLLPHKPKKSRKYRGGDKLEKR